MKATMSYDGLDTTHADVSPAIKQLFAGFSRSARAMSSLPAMAVPATSGGAVLFALLLIPSVFSHAATDERVLANTVPAHVASLSPDVLRVGVSGGFVPAMTNLSYRLQQLLGMRIVIISGSVKELYSTVASTPAAYDLIINGRTEQLNQLAQQRKILPDTTTVIAKSQVVLWCPSNRIQPRVSILGTLQSPGVQRVALSASGSPVSQLVERSLFPLPATIQLVRTGHSLASWRMARNGQVDCAFTMRGLMSHSDRFQVIPNQRFDLITSVPASSTKPDTARQLIQILNSPVIQARMQVFGYL